MIRILRFPNFVPAAWLAVLVLQVPAALAGTCFEKSPRFEAMGDAYFDIPDVTRLTQAQQAAVIRLAQGIQGEWSGTGVEHRCTGNENDPRPEQRDFRVTIDFSMPFKADLRIAEERFYLDAKVHSSEVARLFGASSNARLLSIDDSGVTAVEIYRQGSVGAGTSLWEVEWQIRLEEAGLRVTTTRYINGYSNSQDIRLLHRAR